LNPFFARWVYITLSAKFTQIADMTRSCWSYGQSALAPLYVNACITSASHDSNLRLVEGEWTDPTIPDPLSDMFALLTARRNRALTQQWGVWLAGKDAERALKVRHHVLIFFVALRVLDATSQLLTAHGSAKRGQKAEDEAATLQQIRAVNPEAGVRFLEHLVLQKRRTVGLPLATI